MIAKILQPKNLTLACRRVVGNKGSAGVDNMGVKQLKEYIDTHRIDIVSKILKGDYIPNAIKGVEILKKNDERMIPTQTDECLIDIQKREPQAGGLAVIRSPYSSRQMATTKRKPPTDDEIRIRL